MKKENPIIESNFPNFYLKQKKIGNINFINDDNMNVLPDYSDNEFDLAIIDPPYGIGISGPKKQKKGKKSDRKLHNDKGCDADRPSKNFWDELFRVSKNQIIFGANYFVKYLNDAHKGWIIWDKGQRGLTMSDCEIIYTSFDKPTRLYEKNLAILRTEGTIHQIQKPIHLYRWLLQNYAEQGWKIIDTNGGSGSIAIACEMEGYELTIIEKDKEYFDNMIYRFTDFFTQKRLF